MEVLETSADGGECGTYERDIVGWSNMRDLAVAEIDLAAMEEAGTDAGRCPEDQPQGSQGTRIAFTSPSWGSGRE